MFSLSTNNINLIIYNTVILIPLLIPKVIINNMEYIPLFIVGGLEVWEIVELIIHLLLSKIIYLNIFIDLMIM
jgi:hypothetical protein